MIQRCSNPKNDDWMCYGGRGIAVCDRWSGSFEAFLADMGECPDGYEIDRINCNGNYEPGNCRWVTGAVQGANKRSTRLIEFNGETKHLCEWARDIGVTPSTLHYRLARWPKERALNGTATDVAGARQSN